MFPRYLAFSALALILAACGLLDPQAQQGMVFGSQSLQAEQAPPARAARIDAGVMMIQRGVAEKDPARAERFIAIGERLLR